MVEHPIKYITILFISGLVISRVTGLSFHSAQIIFFISIAGSFLIFLKKRNLFQHYLIAMFLPLAVLAAGEYESRPVSTLKMLSDGGRRVVEGVVISIDEREDVNRYIVEGEKIYDNGKIHHIRGRIMLNVESGGKAIVPGDRIRFSGRLRTPRNFGNRGGFDYETFLKDRGIYAAMFLKYGGSIAVMGDGGRFLHVIYYLRERVRKAVNSLENEKANSVLAALTIGSKARMDSSTLTSFRKAGVAHIVAISGLHMGIYAYFFYNFFLWLFSRSERLLLLALTRKGAAIMTFLPLSFYLLISGMSTSAIRAYIMVAIYLCSIILDRDTDIFNTISIAAFIILLIWPQALFDVAFQLSFAAVIAICYLVPRFEKAMPRWNKADRKSILRKFLLFLSVSVAALAGTLPIVSYHFHEVSTVGIIANLIVVPILGFIVVPLAGVGVIASIFYLPAAGAVFRVCAFFISCALAVIEAISNLSFSSILVQPPYIYEIIFYYIFIWSIANIKKRHAAVIALLIPFIFFSSWVASNIAAHSDNRLEVTFLSVGQGDSTFIRFPNGKTMIIDGGGFYYSSFDTGKMIIQPYLLSKGIKRLDYVVISHSHPDHLKGLLHIVREFNIGEVWTSNDFSRDDQMKEFRKILNERGIREIVTDDDSPDKIISGVRIEFLHPDDVFYKGKDAGSRVNNRSLVMRIEFGGTSFLLTGDLEAEGEKRLLAKGYNINSDVLKVPHHGSVTSSSAEFIEKVSPEFAVFTVGYMNRFGFPREEVVRRYEDYGSKLLRTDTNGAVSLVTNGNSLEVKTFHQAEP